MICPICDNDNPSLLCQRCGFDSSRDYGKYPTFGAVGRVPSASALRKRWEDMSNASATPLKPAAPKPSPLQPTPSKPVKPQPAPPVVKEPVKTTVSPPPVGAVPKNKWVAFVLCLFFGIFGIHKYYEGRIGMGILYTCTFGLAGWGWLFDLITLPCKPNPYYPKSG